MLAEEPNGEEQVARVTYPQALLIMVVVLRCGAAEAREVVDAKGQLRVPVVDRVAGLGL